MTKLKRVAFIIITSFVVALVLINIFIIRPQEKAKKEEETSTQTLPQPVIQAPIEIGEVYNIISNLNKNDIQIPENLPIYTLKTAPFSFDESTDIAKSLGFSEILRSLDDINLGKVYVSYENAGSIRIVPSLRLTDFKARVEYDLPDKTFPNDEELKSIAKNYLVDKGLVSEENLEFSQIRFLNLSIDQISIVEKNSANIADVQFREKLGQYPIINVTTGVGTINVKINREGKVASVYVDRTGTISEQKEYPTKTFEELESLMIEAKIVALDQGNINLFELTEEEIVSIAIDKAHIAYFQEYEANQALLQPVFVLRGNAELKTRGTVSATLYLPAISNNYLEP